MRKLLLLSGTVGSGKSSLVSKLGLDDYTLSSDKIRIMIGSRELTSGGFRLPHSVNKQTYDILHSLLEERMRRGEFTVIDAVNSDYNSCKYYANLASKYRYEIAYYQVDKSLKECLDINKNREYFKKVNNDKVIKFHKTINKSNLPFKRIYNIDEYIDDVDIYKLDNYKKVIVIGSLDGKFDRLDKILAEFNNGIKYIFLGNYFSNIDLCSDKKSYWLDRLLDLSDRENIVMLEGCKDSLLADKFRNKLLDCYLFKINGSIYFCNSGGLPYMPERLNLISSYQIINGACDNPTSLWEMNSSKNKGIVQIHCGKKSYETRNSYCLGTLDRVAISRLE